MPPFDATSSSYNISARTTCTIRANDIVEVVCHRKIDNQEEYLVRWQTKPSWPRPPRAPFSWHSLPELYEALHHVQTYIETLDAARAESQHELTAHALTALTANRKRKAPDIEPEPSRELAQNGLLTPGPSTSDRSRSPSDSGLEVAEGDNCTADAEESRVYNVVLVKKAGHIVARSIPKDERVSTARLPTERMLRVATQTPYVQAERDIRHKFLEMLKPVKGVWLQNDVDRSTPSLNFTFIKEYAFRDVAPLSTEFLLGCKQPCKPNMGGHCGCEYTALCDCLEYAAVDEKRLEAKDAEGYRQYKMAQETGETVDTTGFPKRFPYSKPTQNLPQKLDRFYLEQRHPIYECNERCNCGPVCKSRLVQKGRNVDLTIHKTENRGWGVYCNEPLVRGEFIDTYLGEVITSQEADRREDRGGTGKNSYLYWLDKFVGDPDTVNGGYLDKDDCHVVDGQYMGGPTRFINHSCEPNCRQYTVSYNKHDLLVYQLAFFAYEDIPAGTELTFDYMDQDEVEEDVAVANRMAALADPANQDKIRCNCGARKCRGYLW